MHAFKDWVKVWIKVVYSVRLVSVSVDPFEVME